MSGFASEGGEGSFALRPSICELAVAYVRRQTEGGLRRATLIMRSALMADTIETLQKKMNDAALALNFEEAKRYRDMINMMRGGATAAEAEEADFAGLERQKPGAMGLGTSQQKLTPPAGWQAPSKPDLMTSGRSSRGRHRKP